MSPFTFEKLINNMDNVKKINNSEDIEIKLNYLHKKFPTVSSKVKSNKPEDKIEFFAVTNTYVSNINKVFKDVFPESSVSEGPLREQKPGPWNK